TGAPSAAAAKPALPGRFVAFLFDDIHTKPGDLLNGRRAANQQIERMLDGNSRVGIFTTSASTTLDFTGDAAKLHAALDRITPWTSGRDPEHDCPPISYF